MGTKVSANFEALFLSPPVMEVVSFTPMKWIPQILGLITGFSYKESILPRYERFICENCHNFFY